MKCNSIFILITGDLFKSHVICIPCSDEKIADDLPQDMACVFQGQDKILACYNLFDTVLDYPRNSENTDNWEQILGAVSYFHESPLLEHHLSPRITGQSEFGFYSDNKYGVL